MCLIVKDGEKIRTAARNMLVYKRLVPVGNGRYESPCIGFFYYRGRIYQPVELVIDYNRFVEAGFHAFVSRTEPDLFMIMPSEVIVPLIIPKGSQYVLGQYGEIVSSHIRFPKKGEHCNEVNHVLSK